MTHPDWILQGLKLGNEFHFRKKNPWCHNVINLSCFALLLIALGITTAMARFVPLVYYIPIAGLIKGFIYFGFFILVVHEASHRMFIVSHNLKRAQFWNRFFGWAVATPFGHAYDKHWEEGHHIHHIHPMELQDPQNCPKRAETVSLVKDIAKVIFLPGGTVLVEYQCPAARKYVFRPKLLAAQLLFWAVYGFLIVYYVHWSALVAAVIGFKVAESLNVIKIVMEHGGEYAKQADPFLRSCSSIFPLRWFFMPFNISFHFEHHLHYCVPWYDLVNFHRELMKLVPAELHHTYWHHNGEVWSQLRGVSALSPVASAT